MSVPVLDVRSVTLTFGGLVALDGVSLAARRGELHGVIGPNGAGKTSLFDVITGVYRPKSGSVVLNGRDISRLRPHLRTRAGLGRSFQTVGLSPGLTARDNILATVEAVNRVRSPVTRPSRMRERVAIVDEVLEFFGLEEVADRQVTDLPLGTTKLLEVAKVFAGRPLVALLDEPFAGLSSSEGVGRMGLIARRARASDTGVVIIEHDVPLLTQICDTLSVLDAGRLIAVGDPATVMSDPRVNDAYLGEEVTG